MPPSGLCSGKLHHQGLIFLLWLPGLLAVVCVEFDFYLLSDHAVSRRVVAVELWDKVVMAAHVVGAFAVLCCLLGRRLRRGWP